MNRPAANKYIEDMVNKEMSWCNTETRKTIPWPLNKTKGRLSFFLIRFFKIHLDINESNIHNNVFTRTIDIFKGDEIITTREFEYDLEVFYTK